MGPRRDVLVPSYSSMIPRSIYAMHPLLPFILVSYQQTATYVVPRTNSVYTSPNHTGTFNPLSIHRPPARDLRLATANHTSRIPTAFLQLPKDHKNSNLHTIFSFPPIRFPSHPIIPLLLYPPHSSSQHN